MSSHLTSPNQDSAERSNTHDEAPPSPAIFQTPQHLCRSGDTTETIAKVERVVESIVDGLLNNNDELSIAIKVKKSRTAIRTGVKSEIEPVTEFRKVTFPGRTGHEAWRFSTVI